MFLPDINVWPALAFDSHVHHASGNAWYESSNKRCFFCRLTQQGFLRLATNPRLTAIGGVSTQEAWQMYDAMLGDSRIGFAAEPNGLEELWREFTRGRPFSKDLWSDAYLAAFAKAASLELVTFDQGFKQFQDVQCTILS